MSWFVIGWSGYELLLIYRILDGRRIFESTKVSLPLPR
jgi:hypothetical protein